MKAIKIDIKKTWIDVEHGIYREAVRDQVMATIKETGKVPGMTTFQEVTYYPHKVYEPGSLEVSTYLVKEDEEKIFRDLMTIQDETLNLAVHKAVENLWEMKYMEIRVLAFKEIKELSWWKRLFKQF